MSTLRLFARILIVVAIFPFQLFGQGTSAGKPIPVKVVIVAMFERGADTGDTPGEHHVCLNKDGVLGILTGVGTAKAAASVMAVGLDPRFDLSKAYWLIAGIGGGDPADVSLG